MALQVMLEDHTGNKRHQVKMTETANVERLIPATVTALGLPLTDQAGRPMTYHLSYRGRRLQEEETLESVGVEPGETLTLVPEMIAGSSDQPLPM
jgi:hypothetical protein